MQIVKTIVPDRFKEVVHEQQIEYVCRTIFTQLITNYWVAIAVVVMLKDIFRYHHYCYGLARLWSRMHFVTPCFGSIGENTARSDCWALNGESGLTSPTSWLRPCGVMRSFTFILQLTRKNPH